MDNPANLVKSTDESDCVVTYDDFHLTKVGKRYKRLGTEQTLEMVQEVEPLFVGHARERIVRIYPIEVLNELGEFMLVSVVLYTFFERFPPYDGTEFGIFLTMQFLDDFTL